MPDPGTSRLARGRNAGSMLSQVPASFGEWRVGALEQSSICWLKCSSAVDYDRYQINCRLREMVERNYTGPARVSGSALPA